MIDSGVTICDFSSKNILAPLVGCSDLSYRLLCRFYGAHVTYTEMCIAEYYVRKSVPKTYTYEFDEIDRPLILQLAGNSSEYIIQLANDPMFKGRIDGVDLNCGCPQGFAMEKGYGAGLLENPDLLVSMCQEIIPAIPYPFSMKIRFYKSIEDTIALISRLTEVGVKIITIHGRYHWQKGEKRGLADWDSIKFIKETFPDLIIIGNGDISNYSEFERYRQLYKVDSVMSGYGALKNPSIFSPEPIEIHTMIDDYIFIARKHHNRIIDILRHIGWMIKSKNIEKT